MSDRQISELIDEAENIVHEAWKDGYKVGHSRLSVFDLVSDSDSGSSYNDPRPQFWSDQKLASYGLQRIPLNAEGPEESEKCASQENGSEDTFGFTSLMDEHTPIDYSNLGGVVVFEEDEWNEWCNNVVRAHQADMSKRRVGEIGFEDIQEAEQREYIKLPTDTDGSPINIGDHITDWCGTEYTVHGICFDRDGWSVALVGKHGRALCVSQNTVDTLGVQHAGGPAEPAPGITRDAAKAIADDIADWWYGEARTEYRRRRQKGH